ncbi:MAG: sugar phosphate nucleotidyltransferase [Rhodobacteraceae bacterium]|nr:sugar phosphate nucleotidyltransferase [Paracoccaceae bacterium]
MRPRATAAILPVAGLGTRFRPGTTRIPRELLPAVDLPLIRHATDAARAAGIRDVIFVAARGRSAWQDDIDAHPAPERHPRKAGRDDPLAALGGSNIDGGHLACVRQHAPPGRGHAVWCARRLAGARPFAVILPDDPIPPETPCRAQMMEVHAEHGGSGVAAMRVAPGAAPSDMAVTGRGIPRPAVLRHPGAKADGAGGGIQLTDAIARALAGNPGPHVARRFEGTRHDCGSKAGRPRARVDIAPAHPEPGPALRDVLARRVPAAARAARGLAAAE